MQHRTNLYILKLSFFSFCLIATLVSITQVSAEGGANNTVSTSSSATASVTVSSACSFERIGTGTGEYTGTLTNNGSVEVPGSTFKTICNDPGGYAIYAIGYSNDTLGNTDLIFNNTSESTNNIKTDGANGNSYWKMKAEGVSSPGTPPSIVNDFDNYHTIPTAYTKIAELNTTTDTASTISENITGSSISVSYQAYASSIQPAGTYTGAVKYTMVHPNVTTGNPYIIIFDSNGGTGDMNAQAILPNTSTPLSANTYTAPTGKAFGGWCTTDTAGCQDGTIYTNEQSVANLTAEGGEVTLYAMWYYTMQDITSTQLAELMPNLNDSTRLVDKRDGKTYWVAKLGDTNSSNYWMTQNLDLNLSSKISLTSNDTDLNLYGSMGYDDNNGYTCSNSETTDNCANATETITWIPERSTILPGELNSGTWVNDNLNPYSYDRGLVYPDSNAVEAIAGNHGLAGNYYNWTAAIASNASNSYSGGNAANSICPKGWKLPNSGSYEFSKLLYAYDIVKDATGTAGYKDNTSFLKMASSPLWFIRSGFISGGAIDSSEGRYIASTASSDSGAYSLFYASWGVAPDVSFYRRWYGWSIRCLAR